MKIIRSVAGMLILVASFCVEAATCNASSSGVSFGDYMPAQRSPNESSGALTISCARSGFDSLPFAVNYTVEISRGNSGNFSPRNLRNGSYVLNYNLYRDFLRSDVWGDGTGGSSISNGSMILPANSGTAFVTQTIYGRVFAGQNVGVGTYTDSIVVTISY